MPESMNAILVNQDLRPAYYDDFRCLMSDCHLNCCTGGWEIAFGKKDYFTIKKQKGSPELNKGLKHCLHRIREGVDENRRYGEFVLQDGACPLLRDGKCGLQMEKGERVLPFVCRSFPRIEMLMPSGYLERSLSPACEGVLALLWELEDGIEFRSDPLDKVDWKFYTYNASEEKSNLQDHFQEIRAKCIDILQDRCHSLPERILLLGLSLKLLVDGETSVPDWMERSDALLKHKGGAELLKEDLLPMFLLHNLNTLSAIHSNAKEFIKVQEAICTSFAITRNSQILLGSVHAEPYLTALERFNCCFAERDFFFENLIVTLFFHLRMPVLASVDELWKSYVNFCNLCSAFRFASVMSCRDGVEDCDAELMHTLVLSIRELVHSRGRQDIFLDNLYSNKSSTLAHMAILLSG